MPILVTHVDPPHRAVAPLRAALSVLLLALLVAGCGPASATSLASEGLAPRADGWRGVPLEPPREMPEVTLTTTEGQDVMLAEAFRGTPTLLFFGYTSCPDICPIHLAAIASAMESTGVGYDELDVVFVSVDPSRDTPGRIEEFLANFSDEMIGLHGERAALESALEQLGLPPTVDEGPDPRGGGDLVGHPAQVIGFDAQGRALRVWPFGARRADWVADLPRILEEWS